MDRLFFKQKYKWKCNSLIWTLLTSSCISALSIYSTLTNEQAFFLEIIATVIYFSISCGQLHSYGFRALNPLATVLLAISTYGLGLCQCWMAYRVSDSVNVSLTIIMTMRYVFTGTTSFILFRISYQWIRYLRTRSISREKISKNNNICTLYWLVTSALCILLCVDSSGSHATVVSHTLKNYFYIVVVVFSYMTHCYISKDTTVRYYVSLRICCVIVYLSLLVIFYSLLGGAKYEEDIHPICFSRDWNTYEHHSVGIRHAC